MWHEAKQRQLNGVYEIGKEGGFLGKGSARTQRRNGSELGAFMDMKATGLIRQWNLITK